MRSLIPLLLCLVLAGCASLQETRQQNRNSLADDRIAQDATNQLAQLYPPAKTQFNLGLSEPREFGKLLAAKLRTRGYAVSETVKTKRVLFADTFAGFQQKPGVQSDEPQARGMETPTAAGQGTELSYTLDTPEHASLYAITLKVGNSYLSRAYLPDAKGVAAAGAWTYRGQ
ncbi:conjugative transfer protein TrbH [Nitrosospira multiformis]|uniref:Conjugative transfer protein TrbH n=1 Tax=Nitrosospira multiformis TaxID=1231 RepID=A0A2T5I6I4_9PROT|nr:conjugal transfer protein TrbH [Nitrosospira multiformis]PTQ79433.1 conjugative transfer protein TrbH [Nitrosospira multiformis]